MYLNVHFMGITNEPKISVILFIIDKLMNGINWAVYVS